MCVGAGLFVGGANYALFKVVVSRELRRVVDGMQHVNEAVQIAEDTGDGCRDSCRLEVTSNDLIGRVAESFNRMTEAIALRITRESKVRLLLSDLSETIEIDAVADRILNGDGRCVRGPGRHSVRPCSDAGARASEFLRRRRGGGAPGAHR